MTARIRERKESNAGKKDVNLPKILDNPRFNQLMVIFMASPEGTVSLFRPHASLHAPTTALEGTQPPHQSSGPSPSPTPAVAPPPLSPPPFAPPTGSAHPSPHFCSMPGYAPLCCPASPRRPASPAASMVPAGSEPRLSPSLHLPACSDVPALP